MFANSRNPHVRVRINEISWENKLKDLVGPEFLCLVGVLSLIPVSNMAPDAKFDNITILYRREHEAWFMIRSASLCNSIIVTSDKDLAANLITFLDLDRNGFMYLHTDMGVNWIRNEFLFNLTTINSSSIMGEARIKNVYTFRNSYNKLSNDFNMLRNGPGGRAKYMNMREIKMLDKFAIKSEDLRYKDRMYSSEYGFNKNEFKIKNPLSGLSAELNTIRTVYMGNKELGQDIAILLHPIVDVRKISLVFMFDLRCKNGQHSCTYTRSEPVLGIIHEQYLNRILDKFTFARKILLMGKISGKVTRRRMDI